MKRAKLTLDKNTVRILRTKTDLRAGVGASAGANSGAKDAICGAPPVAVPQG